MKSLATHKLGYAQDVYRIGTLMELVRTLALSFADDGKRVKVPIIFLQGKAYCMTLVM